MAEKPRRENFDVSSNSKNDGDKKIELEVRKLRKKGTLTMDDIEQLRDKYSDDKIIDEIIRLRSKMFGKIKKQAKELAEKMHRKYMKGNMPLHEILEKMKKYKQ